MTKRYLFRSVLRLPSRHKNIGCSCCVPSHFTQFNDLTFTTASVLWFEQRTFAYVLNFRPINFCQNVRNSGRYIKNFQPASHGYTLLPARVFDCVFTVQSHIPAGRCTSLMSSSVTNNWHNVISCDLYGRKLDCVQLREPCHDSLSSSDV